MKPLTRSLRFWLLGASILFSGMTIDASTGRGFILLALPVIGLLTLTHLLTHTGYRIRWLIGVIGFIFLGSINGSRPGSVFLVLICLVLFESLRVSQQGREIAAIDLRWLALFSGALALLAMIDLLTGRVLGLWSIYAEHESQFLDLPRLKLFFSEPSYLGVFSVAVFFKLRGYSRFQKITLLVTLLTQSMYAVVYFLFLKLRRKALFLLGAFIFAIAVVFFISLEGGGYFFLVQDLSGWLVFLF